MAGSAQSPSIRASYLLAVEKARNRLPPRTTSVWAHSASPAELAMGPPAASGHVRPAAPFLLALASDVTRRRANSVRARSMRKGEVSFDLSSSRVLMPRIFHKPFAPSS